MKYAITNPKNDNEFLAYDFESERKGILYNLSYFYFTDKNDPQVLLWDSIEEIDYAVCPGYAKRLD